MTRAPGEATVKDALNVLRLPYVATAYVDPGFAGTSTGSQSNPYTTIAAAFAAMTGAGLSAGIVFYPAEFDNCGERRFPD